MTFGTERKVSALLSFHACRLVVPILPVSAVVVSGGVDGTFLVLAGNRAHVLDSSYRTKAGTLDMNHYFSMISMLFFF